MSLPSQVANWLFNVIQPQYINKELVYSDVYQFLSLHYKQNFHFKVRTQVYTWPESGQSDLLLQLYSSLLVNGVNIPVEIWIPFDYPYRAIPIVYVIPDLSQNLYIKPNNYVDSSGKFYHPYLTKWYNHYLNQNELNLINLTDIMYLEFMKDIPITNIQSSAPPKPAKVGDPNSRLNPPINNQNLPISNQSTGQMNQYAGPTNQYSGPTNQSVGPANQYTGLINHKPINHQSTGPPIPAKPQAPISSQYSSPPSNVPLKYQQPLPVPPLASRIGNFSQNYGQSNDYQSPTSSYNSPNPAQSPNSFDGHFQLSEALDQHRQSPNFQPSSSHSPNYPSSNYQSVNYSSNRYQSPKSYTQSPHPQEVPFPIKSPVDIDHHPIPTTVTPIDLIDSQDIPATNSSNKQLLVELSNKINQLLPQETHSHLIPKISENSKKVEALYSQLTHHYEQAKANSENLNYHINYLNAQVENLTKFNQDLQKLELLNHQQQGKIFINQEKSIQLDELIIPDSILVKQLYEVVADIKAIKDSISLIGGSLPQANELINDDNVETCVKTVRNLSRELFWLELTKNEIAQIMQLQQ